VGGWLGGASDAHQVILQAHSSQHSSQVVVLFDGRIHDRRQLADLLNLPPDELTDADLVLHAYLRFGENFPAHFSGEFAFALWDERHRRLIIGRDAMGARGLYFWRDSRTFLFATDIHSLLACPEVPVVLDEEPALLWLARCQGLGEGTFFKDISRVQPGHILVIHSGEGSKLRFHRFWRPEEIRVHRLQDPQEYADGLLDILKQSVQSRIQPNLKVGTHLSGGLDSSTVTALAAESLAAQNRNVIAFTGVPSSGSSPVVPSNQFADESFHAASLVAQHKNLEHILIANGTLPLFDALDHFSDTWLRPFPNPLNASWLLGIEREASRRGIQLLLGARTGNLTASYNSDPFTLSTLLLKGRILALTVLAWQRRRYGISPLNTLRMSASRGPIFHAKSMLYSHVQGMFGTLDPGFNSSELILAASPMRSDLFKAHPAVVSIVTDTFANRSDSRLDRIEFLRRIDASLSYTSYLRGSGIEFTDPMNDRRLAEFCLTVPDEAFSRNGQPRSLIRDAMQGRLPDKIRLELRRGAQAADASSIMQIERSKIVAEIQRMKRSDLANKFLDMPVLTKLAEGLPDGNSPNSDFRVNHEGKLMRGISFGRFVRRMEDGTLFTGRQ
jgi:asparagine synthase (glutamine-hydrolysing)